MWTREQSNNHFFLSDSGPSIPDSGNLNLVVALFRYIFASVSVSITMKRKEVYRGVILVIGILVAMLALALQGVAQSQAGYMYAKVHTKRTTYTGPIRWGADEVFWSDLFNASKGKNEYAKFIPREEERRDFNWLFSSIWEDQVTTHQFTCQFGNIKEIVPTGDDIYLKLKNGLELELEGEGYTDIGGKVQVLDEEIGVVNINWENVDRIEFLPAPNKLEQVFGLPLYGTVEGVRNEKFTGFILWDNDERVLSDKLDGDGRDGDVSIKFSDIASIAKAGDGSEVTLKSGRSLFLRGSNDVNSENRGVWVVDPDYGIIKFSWKAFRQVTFSQAPGSGLGYDQYATPKPMQATVSLLGGKDVFGQIIYDVDEKFDFELIEGRENDIEYSIPLRNIKRITPKNFDYSLLELVSGKTLLLGGMRDVSEDNSGLLVFTKEKKDPVYIPWKKVNEIVFH
jgi:hypothetical protein